MEAYWNGFGSQSFPNVPERAARFARFARSLAALVHRGEFSLIFQWFFHLFFILEIVSKKYSFELDFQANLAPCWPHFPTPGASWGVLGASWVRLGASWVRLVASCAGLGAS